MGSRRKPSGSASEPMNFDHDRDRFPTLKDVFARILDAEDIPSGQVLRVEVGCLANGDATYRVWARESEEPIGGFLPAATSS
jgi:hypothetical protein